MEIQKISDINLDNVRQVQKKYKHLVSSIYEERRTINKENESRRQQELAHRPYCCYIAKLSYPAECYNQLKYELILNTCKDLLRDNQGGRNSDSNVI